MFDDWYQLKHTASAAGFLPVIVTFAPAFEKRAAVARPIPLDDPEKITIFQIHLP